MFAENKEKGEMMNRLEEIKLRIYHDENGDTHWLISEIERLRKALEEIVDDTETRDGMMQIAVEALKEE